MGAEMERAVAAAAVRVRMSLLQAVLLLLASMVASEGVTHDASRIPLLQSKLQADEQGSQSASSSYSGNSLLSSAARAAVFDGIKDAAADILMFPTKIKSTVTTTCSYTVTIKTSCYSPKITRDAISLSFGDGHGNQVYASRLDDPVTGTFDQCATDTFQIQGPCGAETCYLYLRRSGDDGWAPDWVTIAPSNSSGGENAVTFYYNGSPIPADVWYGFNLCPGEDSGGGSGSGNAVVGAAGLASGVLVLLLHLVI